MTIVNSKTLKLRSLFKNFVQCKPPVAFHAELT